VALVPLLKVNFRRSSEINTNGAINIRCKY